MRLAEIASFFAGHGNDIGNIHSNWTFVEDDLPPLSSHNICVIASRYSIILRETVYHALLLPHDANLLVLSDYSLLLSNERRYSSDITLAQEAQSRYFAGYVDPRKVAQNALRELHAKRAQIEHKESYNADHT